MPKKRKKKPKLPKIKPAIVEFAPGALAQLGLSEEEQAVARAKVEVVFRAGTSVSTVRNWGIHTCTASD